MANQQHLDILRQGVEVWNEWLENSSDIKSLGETDLSNADLRETNLSRIILNGVNLRGGVCQSILWK